MSTKDISATASGGAVQYNPASPFVTRANTIDFATTGVAASGGDTVKVLPLNKGEFVLAAYLRIDEAGTANATVKLDDNRTGGGAVIGTTGADAEATTKGAGAALGAVGSTDGYLTLTTVAAVALAAGKATVYAVIGSPF